MKRSVCRAPRAPKKAADLWRGLIEPDKMPPPDGLRQDITMLPPAGLRQVGKDHWRMAQYAYSLARPVIGPGPCSAEIYKDADAAVGDCVAELLNGEIPWINAGRRRRRHVAAKAAVRLTRGNRIVAVVEIPGDPADQIVLCRIEAREPRFGDVMGLHYGPRGLEGVYVLTSRPRVLNRHNIRECCAFVSRETAFAETEAALGDLFGRAA